MKIITHKIYAFEFSELSEEAKETAKQEYMNFYREPSIFSEALCEELNYTYGLNNLKAYQKSKCLILTKTRRK